MASFLQYCHYYKTQFLEACQNSKVASMVDAKSETSSLKMIIISVGLILVTKYNKKRTVVKD